jgi:hypothetical protein
MISSCVLKPSGNPSDLSSQAIDSDRPLAGFWTKPVAGHEWVERQYHDAFRRQPDDPGPWLIPIGDDWIRYPILRRRRLLPELVDLGKKCTPDRILAFANRWGSLGLGERTIPGAFCFAASLTTWHQQSEMISALWHLWEWTRMGKVERLAPYVHWERPTYVSIEMVVRGGMPDEELTKSTYPRNGSTSSDPRNDAPGEFLYAPFQRLAEESDDPWGLLKKWAFAVRYIPDSLLTAAYIQLQDHIAGGVAVERDCLAPFCPSGGRFVPKRRDQLYCDALCRNRAYYYSAKAGGSRG